MKAKILNPQENGKNMAQDKEMVAAYSVVGKIDGKLREVVCARAYMGRSSAASVVYASLWVVGKELYCAGHGRAGGYGYHKESAAFQEAISNAGIKLYGSAYSGTWNQAEKREYNKAELAAMAKKECHIDGVGSSAMQSAFEAIARAVGAKGELLYITH